ncbi:hypothetical protein CXG81DRAFT_23616 [Caulochytrium protostelioides]|uniref:N-acetyltransferase domain-containing protein n=1 Tax=Caulochytrium protostelioides TaxID=1555241 RepID=A0A4P9XF17_9FUNG|nr:hypothetical protein CXG81DRAFT_23616 [Caulochytrium protostelioides]|eukprot:RKP03781.1 hypothetical protein CXG81DRAFT_23616 [Caulochytrium protostelioides]
MADLECEHGLALTSASVYPDEVIADLIRQLSTPDFADPMTEPTASATQPRPLPLMAASRLQTWIASQFIDMSRSIVSHDWEGLFNGLGLIALHHFMDAVPPGSDVASLHSSTMDNAEQAAPSVLMEMPRPPAAYKPKHAPMLAPTQAPMQARPSPRRVAPMYGWVALLALLPTWRWQGYGLILLEALMRQFHDAGVRYVTCEIPLPLHSARRLAARAGFREGRRLVSLRLTGLSAKWWRHRLASALAMASEGVSAAAAPSPPAFTASTPMSAHAPHATHAVAAGDDAAQALPHVDGVPGAGPAPRQRPLVSPATGTSSGSGTASDAVEGERYGGGGGGGGGDDGGETDANAGAAIAVVAGTAAVLATSPPACAFASVPAVSWGADAAADATTTTRRPPPSGAQRPAVSPAPAPASAPARAPAQAPAPASAMASTSAPAPASVPSSASASASASAPAPGGSLASRFPQDPVALGSRQPAAMPMPPTAPVSLPRDRGRTPLAMAPYALTREDWPLFDGFQERQLDDVAFCDLQQQMAAYPWARRTAVTAPHRGHLHYYVSTTGRLRLLVQTSDQLDPAQHALTEMTLCWFDIVLPSDHGDAFSVEPSAAPSSPSSIVSMVSLVVSLVVPILMPVAALITSLIMAPLWLCHGHGGGTYGHPSWTSLTPGEATLRLPPMSTAPASRGPGTSSSPAPASAHASWSGHGDARAAASMDLRAPGDVWRSGTLADADRGSGPLSRPPLTARVLSENHIATPPAAEGIDAAVSPAEDGRRDRRLRRPPPPSWLLPPARRRRRSSDGRPIATDAAGDASAPLGLQNDDVIDDVVGHGHGHGVASDRAHDHMWKRGTGAEPDGEPADGDPGSSLPAAAASTSAPWPPAPPRPLPAQDRRCRLLGAMLALVLADRPAQQLTVLQEPADSWRVAVLRALGFHAVRDDDVECWIELL